MSVNKIILLGRIGQEPTVRYVSDGSKFARFSVATTDRYKDRDGKIVEITDWHSVECWGKKAEFIEKWARKGSQIFIEGRSKHSTYLKDGVQVSSAYVAPDNIQLLDKKPSDNNNDDLPEA